MWLWMIVSFNFLLSLSPTLGLADAESTAAADCEVMIHEPWPTPHIFVPRYASVVINCTGPASTADILTWSIRLPNEDIQLNFFTGTTTLATHGVYELPPIETQGMPQTLRLLINDTARNNGTEIICSNGEAMYLFVVEPVPVTLAVLNLGEESINISWSQDSRSVAVSEAVQTFSLTVSHGSSRKVISLNDSFYYFTAPKDAPPCEVYNFSVTATYVGAIYTGAGCSIPSPALSTILPSLPDIVGLESSLEYSLMKSSPQTTLTVSFEAAKCCEQYPMVNYTLEINGSSSDVFCQSVSPGVKNIIPNLTENTIYLFRVLVSNSVGVVSTNESQIFTTDVQNVTATPVETMDTFVVQCDFITGSNAQGCMVVLVGEFDNITANLSKLEHITSNSKEFPIPHPLPCYHEIFGYDIESDGSVGTLAVPGVIMSTNERVVTSCPSMTTPEEFNTVMIIVIGSSVAAAIFILISMTIICIVICCKIKRSKKGLMVVQPLNVCSNKPDTNGSELAHCTDEELETQAAEILYDQPVKARERCSGDGAEYEKTKHIKDLEDITGVEREMNTYAELVEENHHYHTLEPQRVPHGLQVDPDAPALPPPYRPPSPEPLPAYQEIGSLQVAKYDQERDVTNGEIVNDQYQSSQNQVPSDGAQVSSETVL